MRNHYLRHRTKFRPAGAPYALQAWLRRGGGVVAFQYGGTFVCYLAATMLRPRTNLYPCLTVAELAQMQGETLATIRDFATRKQFDPDRIRCRLN